MVQTVYNWWCELNKLSVQPAICLTQAPNLKQAFTLQINCWLISCPYWTQGNYLCLRYRDFIESDLNFPTIWVSSSL